MLYRRFPMMKNMVSLSRREALRLLAAVPALGGPLAAFAAQDAPPADLYGGFRMSIATYSLRKLPVAKALEAVKGFGLAFAEVNPIHLPVGSSAEKVAEVKGMLETNGINPYAFGVFYPERSKDPEQGIKDAFAQAKAVGIKVISADYDPKWVKLIEELAVASDVRIGIHNHGSGSRYGKIEQVVKSLEGRDEHLGATVDVGNFLVAGEDPVKAIHALGKRVYGVHLKDVKNEKPAIVGTGDLDLKGV